MTETITEARANFIEAVNGSEWATVDKLVEMCDAANVWPEDFIDTVLINAKKSFVRRQIKQLKDDENWPLWASVETQNEDGETVRIYKQETLFDVEDYRQVVAYHADRREYHGMLAEGYVVRCNRRFHVQLKLSFGDVSEATPNKPR